MDCDNIKYILVKEYIYDCSTNFDSFTGDVASASLLCYYSHHVTRTRVLWVNRLWECLSLIIMYVWIHWLMYCGTLRNLLLLPDLWNTYALESCLQVVTAVNTIDLIHIYSIIIKSIVNTYYHVTFVLFKCSNGLLML